MGVHLMYGSIFKGHASLSCSRFCVDLFSPSFRKQTNTQNFIKNCLQDLKDLVSRVILQRDWVKES